MNRIVMATLAGVAAGALATGTALATTPPPSPTGTSTPTTSQTVTVAPTATPPTTTPPTMTPPITQPPTTPAVKAKITVTPQLVTTRGAWITITVVAPNGTDKAVVESRALGRHELKGRTELTVRTFTDLAPGVYPVSLYLNGTGPDAETSLRAVFPKPIGPAKTGDGATQPESGRAAVGLGLIAAGGLATAAALRRRSDHA
ncbi:hypothetical protein ACBI99_45165 [Nonomuraea sp. ATR24]|uniref:hypothetical protein n=1 Tax=Nonomuraea TaxID=83681 RepID=UPI001C5F86FF|nr:hypothetical protein [Nonomuraea ceibae]